MEAKNPVTNDNGLFIPFVLGLADLSLMEREKRIDDLQIISEG
jgi:hypothetical protein